MPNQEDYADNSDRRMVIVADGDFTDQHAGAHETLQISRARTIVTRAAKVCKKRKKGSVSTGISPGRCTSKRW
jgi:hypothetical protein